MNQVPKPGDIWMRISSGNLYLVLYMANLHADQARVAKYPLTVVYRRLSDGTVWSRPYSLWPGHYGFYDRGFMAYAIRLAACFSRTVNRLAC